MIASLLVSGLVVANCEKGCKDSVELTIIGTEVNGSDPKKWRVNRCKKHEGIPLRLFIDSPGNNTAIQAGPDSVTIFYETGPYPVACVSACLPFDPSNMSGPIYEAQLNDEYAFSQVGSFQWNYECGEDDS